MKKTVLLILLISVIQFQNAQSKAVISLQKESKLTIHGSTNLLNFTLIQTGKDIQNKPVPVVTNVQENKLFVNQNNLTLKVKNFYSNNPVAESEFFKMMQIEKYPTLKIHLHHFERNNDNSEKNIQGNATVSFTITGETKTYSIPVISKILDNKLYIQGSKKMTIRDFGIEPPVALLGLVRVSEWIEIDFDLVCEYKIVG